MTVHPHSLAIELTQQDACVAATNSEGVVFSKHFSARRREADNAMPSINAVLSEAKLAPQEIQMIAVSSGPGSFTGLRIACSIAKMISFVAGASIVSVETAVVASATLGVKTGPLNVINAVKEDTFWLSETQIKKGIWNVSESSLSSPEFFVANANQPAAVLCDNHLPLQVAHYLKENKIPMHEITLEIESLLIEATARLERGLTVSPVDLGPIYPREPEAVRKWNADKKVL